jgi:non-heme chloroperoxidase
MAASRREVTVGEGVRLSYLEAGEGPTVLIIPGLGGSAAKFAPQLDGLSDRYRVIAVDPRGHGESSKPAHGYSFAVLASDLEKFIRVLGLSDVAVLAHSAGCKILLSYWELFDPSPFRAVIFSDDAPCCIDDGAFTLEEAAATVAALGRDCAEEEVHRFTSGLVSPYADARTKDLFARETLKLPRFAHVSLLRWALFGDWWDAVSLVDVPSLVLGGRLSKNPWRNAVRLHQALPGSQLVIFEASERGAHAVYWENPRRYNQVVGSFLDALPAAPARQEA